MKGKMKKLFALALAAIMVLAMGMTALASGADATDQDNTDNTSVATITVNNTTVGQKYQIYKIFDSSYTAGGASYTATKTQKVWFESQEKNPFQFEQTAVSDVYNVKSSATPDEVIAFFEQYYEDTEDGTIVLNSDLIAHLAETSMVDEEDGNGTSITFSVNTYGYYFVASSLGATVSVSTTNPNATVIDKNQKGPSWDTEGGKTITGINGTVATVENDATSAKYGDVINFKISIDATNYEGTKQITEYHIWDIMDAGMSYVKGTDGNVNVVVKVTSTDVTFGTNGVKTLGNTEYTFKEKSGLDDGKSGFDITIPWGSNGNTTYPSPAKITVEYSAKVETTAIPATGILNKADYEYKRAGDTAPQPSKGEETTTTYTYALAINKVDGNGDGLKDAEFEVRLDGSNTPISVVGQDGMYRVAVEGDEGATTTVKSGEDGLIVIQGVAAGKYWVKETKAPAGYNLLETERDVTAVLNGTYTKTSKYTVDAAGNVTYSEDGNKTVTTSVPVTFITVVNKIGTLLPSTGGIGTTIFYVVGGVLVVVAGILLITKKRMSGRD